MRTTPVIAVAILLSACGTTQPDRTQGGAAGGAATGAAVGPIGGPVGVVVGAVIGGGAGALTGASTSFEGSEPRCSTLERHQLRDRVSTAVPHRLPIYERSYRLHLCRRLRM